MLCEKRLCDFGCLFLSTGTAGVGGGTPNENDQLTPGKNSRRDSSALSSTPSDVADGHLESRTVVSRDWRDMKKWAEDPANEVGLPPRSMHRIQLNDDVRCRALPPVPAEWERI